MEEEDYEPRIWVASGRERRQGNGFSKNEHTLTSLFLPRETCVGLLNYKTVR
jgi:hypothetical protein